MTSIDTEKAIARSIARARDLKNAIGKPSPLDKLVAQVVAVAATEPDAVIIDGVQALWPTAFRPSARPAPSVPSQTVNSAHRERERVRREERAKMKSRRRSGT